MERANRWDYQDITCCYFRRNFGIKLEIFENISILVFWTVDIFSLATYDLG